MKIQDRTLTVPFKMNIIYLMLLCECVFFKVGAGVNDLAVKDLSFDKSSFSTEGCPIHMYYHPSVPIDYMKMKIMGNGVGTVHVDLKKTNRVLANENLPVWILNGVVDMNSLSNLDGSELERSFDVMKQLGEFTAYQQSETSSAAIYFHARHEFDGMIGHKLVINKLSVYSIHPEGEALHIVDQCGIYRHSAYKGHHKDFDLDDDEDLDAGVNYQKHLKTYKGRVYDGYPEVLVIVSWDLTQDWTKSVKKSNWYTTVVSHVLTLFNGVDMLYSKLQKTKIQINIAGIIIGTDKESFFFLNDCYHKTIGKEETTETLDTSCGIAKLVSYLRARKQKLPIDSYDLAVLLTRNDLIFKYDEDTSQIEPVLGLSRTINDLYAYRSHDDETTLIAIITDDENTLHHTIIAHEIAHSMSVYHDESPFFTANGECCANILKPDGDYWCDKCLLWSKTSEESFNLFFSSPNCCAFINKPRSLLPPGIQEMLTADEQCQCYGYESAWKYEEAFATFCYRPLQCNGVNHEHYHTVIPMDGTSCGDNKVCYQRTCQKIRIYNH